MPYITDTTDFQFGTMHTCIYGHLIWGWCVAPMASVTTFLKKLKENLFEGDRPSEPQVAVEIAQPVRLCSEGDRVKHFPYCDSYARKDKKDFDDLMRNFRSADSRDTPVVAANLWDLDADVSIRDTKCIRTHFVNPLSLELGGGSQYGAYGHACMSQLIEWANSANEASESNKPFHIRLPFSKTALLTPPVPSSSISKLEQQVEFLDFVVILVDLKTNSILLGGLGAEDSDYGFPIVMPYLVSSYHRSPGGFTTTRMYGMMWKRLDYDNHTGSLSHVSYTCGLCGFTGHKSNYHQTRYTLPVDFLKRSKSRCIQMLIDRFQTPKRLASHINNIMDQYNDDSFEMVQTDTMTHRIADESFTCINDLLDEVDDERTRRNKAEADLETASKLSCRICFGPQADRIYVPCNHGAMCHDCAVRWRAQNGTCLTCRQPVTGIVQIFVT